MTKLKIFILLHVMLMLYSMSGICAKLAAGYPFLGMGFSLCYAAMVGLLGVYAIGWQQVIKHLPLTVAFANKAVSVIWGLVWGVCFFHEPVTVGKVAGTLLIMAGVVIYAKDGGGLRYGSDNG